MIEMFQNFRCFTFPVRCSQTARTHELLYLSVAVLCCNVVFIAKAQEFYLLKLCVVVIANSCCYILT